MRCTTTSTSHGLEPLLRLSTTAAALDTPVETLRYWIRTGRLESVKLGGRIYLRRRDIDQLIKDGERKRPAKPDAPEAR